MPSKRPRPPGLDSYRRARTEEVRLRVRRLEREESLAEKVTVRKADVDDFLFFAATHMKSALYSRLVDEAPGQLQGLDVADLRRRMTEIVDGLVVRFGELAAEFNGSDPGRLEDDPQVEGRLKKGAHAESEKAEQRKAGRSKHRAA